MSRAGPPAESPIERVERCYAELVAHYGLGGDRREARAAAKLLLVALDRFREHGGDDWRATVEEYVEIAAERPEKLEAILAGNRSVKAM